MISDLAHWKPHILKSTLLSASVTLLLALNGCAMLGLGPSSADQAPPPGADTIAGQPPVEWQDINANSDDEAEAASNTTPGTPPKPVNLWQRMRKHFQLADADNNRLDAKLNWYASHPEYVDRVAQRAAPYLYYIVEQLDERNMPTDLALLPVVESAFDPFAYSRSGASGLWQFMPQTGERFGLDQNWWYDGRRDIVESTRAALDYLQQLHSRFGSWLLALAAYNSGGGRVSWAIRKNKRLGKPTDFWHLDLPRQTRAYIPWLLAIRDIIQNPKKYDITLPPIANKPYLTKVSIDSQIDIAHAAKMADLSLEQMYLLNAGFNRWTTPPNQSQTLLIPIAHRSNFVAHLAALPDNQRAQWARHKIVRGDTLSLIADHYGTTVAVLKRVNRLSSSTIRVGHYLMVPGAVTKLDKRALNKIRELRHIELAHEGHKTYYTVRSGDSLWTIGQRYSVSPKQIARWNHMGTRSVLQIGQRLVLWYRGSAPQRRPRVNYIVQSGDSLWSISQHYNVTMNELASWNDIDRNDVLHIGEKLTILLHGQAISDDGQKIHYTVRSGDSLWSISNQFDVGVDQLANWNALAVDDYLHPGQKLVLYVADNDTSTQS